MKRMLKLVFLVVGSVWLALSATLPKDIVALLERVDKTNASFKTAKASIDMVFKMGGMSTTLKGEIWIDNQTGKFRANFGMGPLQTLLIYDGENLWSYNEAAKEYMKNKLSREEMEKSLFVLMPPAIALSPSCKKNFTSEEFLSTLKKSSLTKGTLNKKSVNIITFVDKTDNSQYKIVVEPKENRILEIGLVMPPEIGQGEMLYKIVSLETNVSFSEGAFTFTPPAGAKEFSMPRGENLEGQMAEDFSLNSLDGKQYTLSALRGKVVLIDFWATWCPPCKKELPVLEKLHRDFKDEGLVVLGISDENKTTIEKFLKENKLTFPILLDQGGKVAQLYKVQAIPRVILIDKKGKIVKDITGYEEENEKILKEAIEKSLKE